MSNRKIVLVNPPYERVAAGYRYLKYITNNSPSLGLLHLAAEVRDHGYQPTIIESDIFDLSIEQVVEQIAVEQPAYVGITLFTVGVWNGAAIARAIKARLPQIIVIVGGPHISSMGKETMERFPEFDYAVDGEGERTLVDLLGVLERGGDPFQVAGVIYRKGPFITVTPGRAINKELDELPFPAWDLLPEFPRRYRAAVFDYPRGPVATIAASRGCPFHCKFCDTSTFGNRVRYYSPKMVFEMMKHLKEQYGVRHVMFVDDLFVASRKRVTELCERLIESRLGLTWSCTSRVDTVYPETLALMKQAGCWEISFGLETGSDELLKKMEKAAEVSKSEQAVGWTAAAGIRSKGLFMLGYPGETLETIEETKRFVQRLPLTIMNLSKFTPYPGSPIYRELYGTNIRDDHWEKMNGMNFVWAPEGISVEELDRHYREVLVAFYRRFHVGNYYIRLMLTHPAHLYRMVRFGLGFAAQKIRTLLSGRTLATASESHRLE